MTAIQNETYSNGTSKLFLVLVLIVVVAGAIALGTIGAMPLSSHAQNGHQTEKYSAAGIQSKINNSTCKDIICYTCPSHAKLMVLCKMSDSSDIWGGLIVSMTTNSVITGYAAPWNYWYKVSIRDGCTQTLFSP